MHHRWTDTWGNTFVACSILNRVGKPDYGEKQCLQVGLLNIPFLIKENKSLWPLPLTLIWSIKIQQDVPDFSTLNHDALTTPELLQTFSVFPKKENAFILLVKNAAARWPFDQLPFSSQSFWTSVIEVSDVLYSEVKHSRQGWDAKSFTHTHTHGSDWRNVFIDCYFGLN